METFLPIAMLFGLALLVSVAVFTLTTLLGPKNPVSSKLGPYECGVKPEGTARTPFKNRFYLIAVLFLIFDVEAAFFFPWALVYRESLNSGPALLIAMLFYMAFVVLALVYILKKKALELR